MRFQPLLSLPSLFHGQDGTELLLQWEKIDSVMNSCRCNKSKGVHFLQKHLTSVGLWIPSLSRKTSLVHVSILVALPSWPDCSHEELHRKPYSPYPCQHWEKGRSQVVGALMLTDKLHMIFHQHVNIKSLFSDRLEVYKRIYKPFENQPFW